MTLDEIAIKHNTDKATTHSVYGHGYTLDYERFFEPLRQKRIKFLEIGVGGGESIRTWLEYFSCASIVGVDIVHDTNEWNTPGATTHPRYTFSHGDQTDETMWACLRTNLGQDWDIIIDDGGHYNNQIIIAFNAMWPYIKSGGLYCIEDLGVSYGAGSVFITPGWPNHMDFIRKLLDDMNSIAPHPLLPEWVHCSKELVIIKKR